MPENRQHDAPQEKNPLGKGLRNIRDRMPDEEFLFDLADFFKVLGDTTRIRILQVLAFSEMCVQDIASLLDMTQSAISHQLRILKQARLVRQRRKGRNTFYSLDDEHVENILREGLDHLGHADKGYGEE